MAWAPFYSGAERALLLTLRSLDPALFVPHVVVGTDGELAAQVRQGGFSCEVRPVAYRDPAHPWAWAHSVWGMARSARRTGAVLVHSNDVPSFQPAGYAARLLRIPAITHVRFPDSEAGFSWFLRPGFRRAVFVSEYLRADASASAPRLFAGRSDVLHDGVELPELPGGTEREALRQSLGLPNEPVVGLTGQISEIKGIWDFVEAASIVTARGVRACFAVLGDDLKNQGALRRQMEGRVETLGLSSRFRFLGFRANAPALIRAFDVVAVPSHIEPLGNATLEAMAAGVPVVGSRTGGIPEMVVDGETGRLVPPRAPEALADALQALLQSPDTRHSYGSAARRRAEREFSVLSHGQRLQSIYERVLSGGPAA